MLMMYDIQYMELNFQSSTGHNFIDVNYITLCSVYLTGSKKLFFTNFYGGNLYCMIFSL